MKRIVLAAALIALGTPALAGDEARPAIDARALTENPSAAKWVFEGCAAYPAGAHATAPASGAQSKPAASETPNRQLAQGTPAKTTE